MNYRTLCIAIAGSAVGVASVLATSFGKPKDKIAFSEDAVFQAQVNPPAFKYTDSYGIYEAENFMILRAAEGADVAGSAQVKITLLRRNKDGTYFTIWVRPSPVTIIPTRVSVVNFQNDPLVITQGRYMDIGASRIPFSVFTISGKCITNSAYANESPGTIYTNWVYDGKVLRLVDKHGKSVTEIRAEHSEH